MKDSRVTGPVPAVVPVYTPPLYAILCVPAVVTNIALTNVMLHCAGFISADSLYMFRASGAHHQEYLKTGTAATGTCVL